MSSKEAQLAVDRSISHDEIVTIDYDTAAYRALDEWCDGSTDGNDATEFWGTDKQEHGGDWRVHVRHVDSERIESLRDEAAKAGDEDMVDICERALLGDGKAVRRCVAAIDATADMGDDACIGVHAVKAVES